MGIRQALLIIILLAAGLLVLGCEPEQQTSDIHKPVGFDSGDECHLCGMIITRFPGPKGEAFLRHDEKVYKFCSTRDLFAWLLQPDVGNRVEAVYVHDMSNTSWDDPQDTALIDAKTAWYVIGSRRKGAMGPTLAAFSERQRAAEFAREYGGSLARFEDIDLDKLR